MRRLVRRAGSAGEVAPGELTSGRSGISRLPSPGRRCKLRGRLLTVDGRTGLTGTVVLNVLAAIAGLGAPWLLGRIVDKVRHISRLPSSTGWLWAGFSPSRSVSSCWPGFTNYSSHRQAERVLTRIRDEFVNRTLNISASAVSGPGQVTSWHAVPATSPRSGQTLRPCGTAGYRSGRSGPVRAGSHLPGFAARGDQRVSQPGQRRHRRAGAVRRARTAYLAEGEAGGEPQR